MFVRNPSSGFELGCAFTRKRYFSNMKKISNTFLRFFLFHTHTHIPHSPTILPPPKNIPFTSILSKKWRMQLLSESLKNLLVLKLQLSLAIVWSQGFSFCPKLIEGLVTHLCSYFRGEHPKYRENHRLVSTPSIKKKK